jgi:hypothetical protein
VATAPPRAGAEGTVADLKDLRRLRSLVATTATASLAFCGYPTQESLAQQSSSVTAASRAPGDGLTVPLGVNLEGVADWARLTPFADLMKSSRAWGLPKTPWTRGVKVDSLGWPTEDAGVVVRIAQQDPGDSSTSTRYLKRGVYKLSFDGRAAVRPVASSGVAVTNYSYDRHTQRSTADVVVDEGAGQIMLAFVETNGGVRNVKLLQPGHREGQTFSDEFLKAIAPFRVLRLMAFLAANGNPVASWSERTLPGAASQSGPKGVAMEYAIQLANETGKDIWINIPVAADDAYVRALAELLKTSLDPATTVYVEYSNELWNYSFAQTRVNIAAAVSEAVAGDLTLTNGVRCTPDDFHAKDCNDFWAGQFRVGKRTARISALFSEVYGAPAMNTRIRPVLATQFANRAIAEGILKNMAKYRGAPSRVIYGIASAPYFYLDLAVATATEPRLDDIFQSLQASLDTDVLPYFAPGVTEKGTFRKFQPYKGGNWSGPSQKAVADYYGIASLAYEGGPDFRQSTSGLPVKFQANMDERMAKTLHQLLSQWYGCGNDLFMYFSLTSAYGRYGYWGLTNDAGNLGTPKYKLVKALSKQAVSDFQACH